MGVEGRADALLLDLEIVLPAPQAGRLRGPLAQHPEIGQVSLRQRDEGLALAFAYRSVALVLAARRRDFEATARAAYSLAKDEAETQVRSFETRHPDFRFEKSQ